jgi:hypothetical protein
VRNRGRRKLMVNRRRKKEGMKKKKKNIFPAKNTEIKKMKKVISMVLTEIDPAPLWRQI